MDWNEILRKTTELLESGLLSETAADDAAKAVGVSPFYLQKGFRLVTGYTMAEYVRCRRLYLAGLEILAGGEKVIDTAYKYGYDTPESFTKAFARFHGVTPTQLRAEPSRLRTFLPLKITISIQGGNSMEFTVEKMEAFSVIGFVKGASFGNSYDEIPKFWSEISEKRLDPAYSAEQPVDEISRAVRENRVGEYGVCIDGSEEKGGFRYIVAGKYRGGNVPEGMELYSFPALDWAKFPCKGAVPDAIQALNTRIFREWLPENREYELAAEANIEWYSGSDTGSPDYESAVWLPVRRKK